MGYFIEKSFFVEIYGFQVRFSLPGSDDGSRRYSCSGTRSLLSVIWLFLSLTDGTPRKLVRHHRSDVQKKQDDTRQSSNDPQTRTPPTYVITELQNSLDLRKLILTGNNPDGPSSCCCKFLVVFSLPVSSAVRCRVLCRKTIGAGTSVRLGFPNARPVVFDELARSSAGQ